jgi:cbb3-type cytochrome oxidase subunit 1
VRAIGGGLFFLGILIMSYNMYKTIIEASEEATILEEKPNFAAQVV